MFGSLPGADHRCWVELLYNRSFCVFVVAILPPSRNIQRINRLAALSSIPQDPNNSGCRRGQKCLSWVKVSIFIRSPWLWKVFVYIIINFIVDIQVVNTCYLLVQLNTYVVSVYQHFLCRCSVTPANWQTQDWLATDRIHIRNRIWSSFCQHIQVWIPNKYMINT